MARRKKVCFRTMKIVKVPVRISFRTGEGKRISFKATKAVLKPTKVCFFTKRKKRR